LAIRRHRLPRFWLVLTLGLVGAAVGAAYWWEKQLPQRLGDAAAEGRLDACLSYGEQLSALRWLGGQAPQEQSRCRRLKAEQLWTSDQRGEALRLQRLLVNSGASSTADQQRLLAWQRQLEQEALGLYRAGKLQQALAVLENLNAAHNPEGTALGDQLREDWNRNRFQKERASQLIPQARWWEALDALNRIDHPWWKAHTTALRKQVERGIEGLRKEHEAEHDSHGSLESNIPAAQLSQRVNAKLSQGKDDWEAFSEACRELGGRVVEAGPETACRR